MTKRTDIPKGMKIVMTLLAVSLITLPYAYASALSNAQKTWIPGVAHGSIMEVKSDYIIVSEKKILLIDTIISGKRIKTSITDGKGRVLEKENLKKGTIVFAKGCITTEDNSQGRVLIATEIYIVPRILNPSDSDEYKGIMQPAKEW
jgi:hypothetical protein